MNLKRYGHIVGPLATALAIWAGTAVAASAEPQPASPTQESRTAARLLRDIRMDSRQIRAHAWQWVMLTNSPTATWYSFDRQWNQIKPPVEDMRMKLVRLEDMRTMLPAWEQKAIDGSKPLIAGIAGDTHRLRMELDRYYNDLSNPLPPASNSEARVLARDAGRLIRTVERPEAQTTSASRPSTTEG